MPYQVVRKQSGRGIEIKVGVAQSDEELRLLNYAPAMVVNPTSTKVCRVSPPDGLSAYIVIPEDELQTEEGIVFISQRDFYGMIDENERDLIAEALWKSVE